MRNRIIIKVADDKQKDGSMPSGKPLMSLELARFSRSGFSYVTIIERHCVSIISGSALVVRIVFSANFQDGVLCETCSRAWKREHYFES